MSVLNQMLHDLERRGVEAQPVADAVRDTDAPATPIVRPLIPPQPRASRHIRLVAWSIVALIVGATGTSYAWYAKHLAELARAPQPLGMQQFGAVLGPSTPVATANAEAPSIRDTAATAEGPPAAAGESATVAATEPTSENDRLRSNTRKAVATSTAAAKPVAVASRAEAPSASTAPAKVKHAAATAASERPAAEITAIVSRPSTPDAALEARAGELIARGRSVEAMSLLTQLLEQSPEHANARATLVALQAESGRRDLALRTLLTGVEFEPMRFAVAAARLQAELGEPGAALVTLDRVPQSGRNAGHEALAGGLAQRTGDHPRAVDAFQRALRTPNAPAVWWAGLAVSLEAIDQPAAALAAFRRAAADPSLPAATRNFALARISTLAASRSTDTPGIDATVVSARP